MKNLIIFDFDDTIVDNSKLDYMGFKIPCKKLGTSFPSKSELKKFRKKGHTAKKIFSLFSKDDDKISKFLKLRKSFLHKESLTYLTLKSNSRYVFKKLVDLDYELVICTVNSNPKMIKAFLKANKIDHFFKKIFTYKTLGITLENNSYSNRILLKTSLLHLIIKKTNSSKNLSFVGNSIEDYFAAKKSKIHFFYFLNSYLPNPKIKNLIKFTEMKQLLSLLKENVI